MNIILSGLVGTGKTTLAKKIEKELKYQYIDLYKMVKNVDGDKEIASKNLASEIDKLLLNIDELVIDSDYLILPSEYIKYKSRDNCIIIYLGFNNIPLDVLFDRFKEEYKIRNKYVNDNQLLEQLKYYKEISHKVFNDCNKYNLKFFDISKEKSEIIKEIYKYILDKLNK